MLECIIQLIKNLQESLSSHKDTDPNPSRIYDNKAVKALLGVKDKYLKSMRDNGFIGYSRHGDKYWYTQEDVDRFLQSCHYKAFATPSNPEGGGLL